MDSLIIAPVKIFFHTPLNRVQRRAVSIMNPTANTVIFKAKTNASKIYNVRPNCAKIMPLETSEIIITYNANEPGLDLNPSEAKHKIIIQSVVEKPEMDGLANLRDAFRINGGEQLISNTLLEISFEVKPGLATPGEEHQLFANTMSQGKTEDNSFKQFEQPFVHESCLDKMNENEDSNMQQTNKCRFVWKIFGFATSILVAGAGYYFYTFANNLENEVFF